MYDPWHQEENVIQPLHDWNIIPKETKIPCCSPQAKLILDQECCDIKPTITWTVSDIAKAARLLTVPPLPTQFEDEQEMRRVYTLIYDTFRYKRVFNEALNDISFFETYPEMHEKSALIWLLFFDMYHRSFRNREPAVIETARELFSECGIITIENAIWEQRVKLAAAVSRLRIKNSALRLSELLPQHLRDERVSYEIQQLPVTCWINPNKVKSEDEILSAIQKSLSCKLLEKDEQLEPNSFKWDTLCPNFIVFHSSLRTALAQSSLVHKHKLIVQDRSFCLGPATFGKVMIDLQLAGTVIQSHVNSPRTTAYLATLLSQNTNITDLLVFNAGPRKTEYEKYLQELGTKNVLVYSEKMIEVPIDSTCFDRAIAVFATPPNSYTAVYDPIDLVCSRGGDLGMLEILTESETTADGQRRVLSILEEQRKTLTFAMSRPQIQFVLYETHSELTVENDDMVQSMINDMNRLAKIKHAEIQGKVIEVSGSKEINNNDEISERIIAFCKRQSQDTLKNGRCCRRKSEEEELYSDIEVPNCDLFCKAQLPNLCSNKDHCIQLTSHGCFLALLQRKEVTKLDNKYMIKVAEERGLFGTPSTTGQTKGIRTSKTKKQPQPSANKLKKKSKHLDLQIDRIAAPTQASMRQSHVLSSLDVHFGCPRCRSEQEPLPKEMDCLQSTAHSLAKATEQWKNYKLSDDKTGMPQENAGFNIPSLSNKLGKNPLCLLKSLTYAGPGLKDLISSRVPYRSPRAMHPNYGWRFYFDRTGTNTNLTSLCDFHKEEEEEDIEICTVSNSAKKSKVRKKREHPLHVLERVSQPTYSSRTKSLHKVNVTDNSLEDIPECEKCKKRNMD